MKQKGRSRAPLGFGMRLIFQRKPQDDPPIDRTSLKLERVAFAVFVRPGCADFGPEGLVALLGDVPCQIFRGVLGLGVGVFFACHNVISLVWVGLLTPSRTAEGIGSQVMVNTAVEDRWCGQAIERRCRIRPGIYGCLLTCRPKPKG